MGKSLVILGQDLTDRTKSSGVETVEITDFIGQLVKNRSFDISDNDAKISPFSLNGLLFRNNWRNEDIDYSDEVSQIQFGGVMKTLGQTIGNSGNVVNIKATEPVGPLMDAIVESNDSTTHLNFKVDNGPGYSPGDQVITIDGGTTEIPVPSLVTFETDLVPRYQVVDVVNNAGATIEITLDRPLEKSLTDDDDIRVSVPAYRSSAGEIKRTLETIGLGSRLGNTFDTLDNFDIANNYLFFINVIIEQRVSVANHIGELLKLSNSFLSVSDQGEINIIRGLTYGGEGIDNSYIGADEIIPEIKIIFNDTSLLFNFNMLYLSGGEVRVITGEADPVYVDQYANRKSWNPIAQGGNLAGSYKYLYANSDSAEYFAQLMLDYYSVPRVEATFKLKGNYHGKPYSPINLQVAKQFFVSFKITENSAFFDEPARVMAYTRDIDNNIYTNVRVQFSNYLLPNIIRNISGPIFPAVVASHNINDGAAVVVCDIRGQTMFIEVFEATKTLIVMLSKSESTGQITGEPRGNYFQIKHSGLIMNGSTYFFKLFTKSGNNFSNKTDFFQFIPARQSGAIGSARKVGVFTI